MPSRRRFLAASSVGMGLTAGCLTAITRPDIPRDTPILDARTTIEAGGYQAWNLAPRIENAPLHPVDDTYVFSYEFTVTQGPPVMLAVTLPEDLERRAQTGNYRVFATTRSHGQRGHMREPMNVGLLQFLVADAQYIDPGTPPPDREASTLHVQAYLSTPDPT